MYDSCPLARIWFAHSRPASPRPPKPSRSHRRLSTTWASPRGNQAARGSFTCNSSKLGTLGSARALQFPNGVNPYQNIEKLNVSKSLFVRHAGLCLVGVGIAWISARLGAVFFHASLNSAVPAPSHYPQLDFKYHQIRTVRLMQDVPPHKGHQIRTRGL